MFDNAPRLSALDAYKFPVPTKWVEEQHFNLLISEYRAMETRLATAEGKTAVLERTNLLLAQELGELKKPTGVLGITPGRCSCAIKSTTLRCDHCGKEA